MTEGDIWSEWVLKRRFPGDPEAAATVRDQLSRVRDGVLRGAEVLRGDTVLDVGCGDGLIGFGALDLVGETGHVIFSDISEPLLQQCRQRAHEQGAASRCSLVRVSADCLSPIEDASVDVVTVRSVLIYVKQKSAAFAEFRRVLKPCGRLSMFEPINRSSLEFDPTCRWGGGITEIADLAARLTAHYRSLQPPDTDPMLDFDERDLVQLCTDAGFDTVKLRLDVNVSAAPAASWEAAISVAGNPRIPSLQDAMRQLFSPAERKRFERHFRPEVERGGRRQLSSVAWLTARGRAASEAAP